MFGLPATAALIFIIAVALRRTRRLYAEAAGRQAAEDALRQAQRLESLGQLTGGVAHDFNNLLMVIGGSVERAKSRIGDAQTGRSLSMIEAAVQKGASLTKQLLSFSRRQSLSPRVWDAVTCVKDFREVLQQSLRGDIQIAFDLADGPLPVRVDRNELEIALLNFVLNARDAMPDGGTIRIGIAAANLRHDDPDTQGLDGEFVSITVSDTGQGIPDEIREHVFEPYFTTKNLDKGTGLGLSQVYGFARQSEGTVTFETQPGTCTVFTLFLPRSHEPLHQDASSTALSDSINPQRVLLVEDNPDVAVVVEDYLEQCGCTVVRADSAEKAIELLNTDKGIELLFSDIVMPGMNGLELARLVRDHHPGMGLILASGYSDKATDAISEGFTLLNKPYSLAALRAALAQTRASGKAAA